MKDYTANSIKGCSHYTVTITLNVTKFASIITIHVMFILSSSGALFPLTKMNVLYMVLMLLFSFPNVISPKYDSKGEQRLDAHSEDWKCSHVPDVYVPAY